MAHIAYLRVSTTDQNTDRQLTDSGIPFDKSFTDKCSGGSTKRPALEALKDYVREGDTIHVHSIDRLARNLVDLKQLINDWTNQGVSVRFHKENLSFNAGGSDHMSELMLNMLGAVAQFELAMIQERRQEGIEKAKAAGRYKGRPTNKTNHQRISELRSQGVSLRKIAAQVGVSLSTVQRALSTSAM
ncbi:TPA: recombinase family protein [Vibrio parahaemolyticus]|uniref:recombinase family protein n=1 Tax=Vibrio parahaemolyticus TaxID=670 RepID=UPI0004007981|nr:recombinase family protein [Vibrio parahaemolyticus]EGQ8249204.1 helix-turn-helix domain-containing protein [Vibrio parahaemolyticus]EGQ8929221.1 helix-turn-helix domain-containing protein [Vibrio parahaemolyticus]EGQ8974083.1 helix-turn-helix domain-containing protein [Vibrio parahaemolyticus]EGQ8978533.1 helix-turn-helix domain-containing protein [Vibrio parahaemolyticus]EGQ8998086.1 helix-turn-helix domain-containing protein [Vibrio parahaemolyticus]